MTKTKTTLLISTLFLGLFFVVARPVQAEVIKNFNSTITVLPDSSILVNEDITYDFEKAIRHGIFRTIPLLNSKKEPIKIDVISVTNDRENSYNFIASVSNGILNIQIGDSNTMISGVKEYHISYRVWGSVAYFKDFDEIYWNITGNDWQVPIQKVEARVVLPNNVFPLKQACYYGKIGSTTNCEVTEANIFTATNLNVKDGLTVAVGFPKGAVSVYQAKVESKLMIFYKTFWPVFMPILVFIYMFLRWSKKGRDPKGHSVVVAQYDVPDNLTPLEVDGIINSEVKNHNISAEIIYLATKGFIKIKQINNENFLGLISKKDYEFILLKEGGFLTNDYDKKILKTIFGNDANVGGVARLSELNDNFYKSISDIDNAVIDTLLNKKYYTNFPKSKITGFLIPVLFIFGAFLLTGGFSGISKSLAGNLTKSLIFIFSIIVSIMIIIIFSNIMSAKSVKGVATKEYLLGLKEYLQIAEKDRINFHNAPEKKPEIFEALLPYAMVLGVVDIWAKEFQDIYTMQPNWYESNISSFSAVAFSHEITTFSALSTTAFSSSPSSSSSGSGGGGFSGGGGGGGGGGSW